MKRAAHRPRRKYPDAPIQRTKVPLENCPFCAAPLVGAGWREVDKYVQTLNGPVHVIGRGKKCSNENCSFPKARYHARQGDKLSLPHCTYGLDVMAYIAHRRNEKNEQFKEIHRSLEEKYQIEISEREVGLLYRRIQALLLGNQTKIRQELKATAKKFGQLLMAVDALQPTGSGAKLYILHELLGGTVISVAMLDHATEDNLVEWLSAYREWRWAVKGTLSDNEKALVAAMKEIFSEAVHQLCQMHFVKDLSEVVHEADRELQKAMRDAMGQLPPVTVPEKEEEQQTEAKSQEQEQRGKNASVSLALMQAMDIISGVEISALDRVTPETWECQLGGEEEEASLGESAGYLSAVETNEWITDTLLAQVPMSARPLVVDDPAKDMVTYWEHMWYRRAIQDTRHLGSRKPFLYGGLRGYEQLRIIDEHLIARQRESELEPYLSKLHVCVRRAVEQTRPLAENVREGGKWIVEVERLLADEPAVDGSQLTSTIQRQRMEELLAECEQQKDAGPTVQKLQPVWRRMLDSWGPNLYHCYDIEGLPRSNLGVEALFGQSRRQQRRLSGQADTSSLRVTGQGYLRTTSTGQQALLEMFRQVPAWVYQLACRCMDAVEAGVRWPRQLHRDTDKALERFQIQAKELHRRAAAVAAPTTTSG